MTTTTPLPTITRMTRTTTKMLGTSLVILASDLWLLGLLIRPPGTCTTEVVWTLSLLKGCAIYKFRTLLRLARRDLRLRTTPRPRAYSCNRARPSGYRAYERAHNAPRPGTHMYLHLGGAMQLMTRRGRGPAGTVTTKKVADTCTCQSPFPSPP